MRALSCAGVPWATTAPWSSTTISSASWSASSRYCVVRTIVVPSSARLRTTCHSCIRLSGSRPVVGSSRNSTLGAPTMLAARSRRRRMPPENVLVRPGGVGEVDEVRAGARRGRRRRSCAARRAGRPSRGWPRAVNRSSTVAAWAATPIRDRTSAAWVATSKPATEARPVVGTDRVVSMRIAVVLPAPLCPRRPRTEPVGTSRSRSRTAQCSPKRLPRPSATTPWRRCGPSPTSAVGSVFVLCTIVSYIARTTILVRCTKWQGPFETEMERQGVDR